MYCIGLLSHTYVDLNIDWKQERGEGRLDITKTLIHMHTKIDYD